MKTHDLKVGEDVLALLEQRKDFSSLPPDQFSYKLAGGFGLDTPVVGDLAVDESTMSMWIPVCDGNRRDGVGDLLDVSGINVSRHVKNPICLYDHGKTVSLPIARARSDPKDLDSYTFSIDVVNKTAGCRAYFYQGENDCGSTGTCTPGSHGKFCAELFDLAAKGFVSSGSVGYTIVQGEQLPPDYVTGLPQGVHLRKILMLECSLVVLPANADTVGKTNKYLGVLDYIGKALTGGTINGSRPSEYFVKAFSPYLPPKTATVTGGYQKDYSQRIPNYRKAEDPDESCETCGAYQPHGGQFGHCNMFDATVGPESTCDRWYAKGGVKSMNVHTKAAPTDSPLAGMERDPEKKKWTVTDRGGNTATFSEVGTNAARLFAAMLRFRDGKPASKEQVKEAIEAYRNPNAKPKPAEEPAEPEGGDEPFGGWEDYPPALELEGGFPEEEEYHQASRNQPPRPSTPTEAKPGSEEKIRDMMRRVEQGEEVADPGRDRWLKEGDFSDDELRKLQQAGRNFLILHHDGTLSRLQRMKIGKKKKPSDGEGSDIRRSSASAEGGINPLGINESDAPYEEHPAVEKLRAENIAKQEEKEKKKQERKKDPTKRPHEQRHDYQREVIKQRHQARQGASKESSPKETSSETSSQENKALHGPQCKCVYCTKKYGKKSCCTSCAKGMKCGCGEVHTKGDGASQPKKSPKPKAKKPTKTPVPRKPRASNKPAESTTAPQPTTDTGFDPEAAYEQATNPPTPRAFDPDEAFEQVASTPQPKPLDPEVEFTNASSRSETPRAPSAQRGNPRATPHDYNPSDLARGERIRMGRETGQASGKRPSNVPFAEPINRPPLPAPKPNARMVRASQDYGVPVNELQQFARFLNWAKKPQNQWILKRSKKEQGRLFQRAKKNSRPGKSMSAIHTKHIRHEKGREDGHQWVLYNHDMTKVLGTHPSREKAEAQEQAVEAHKHFSPNQFPWNGKSLSDLRDKYKLSDGRFHRSKHGSPGVIHMHVKTPELDKLREAANAKGVEAKWVSDDGKGMTRVRLVGMDPVLEELAKQYGRAVTKMKSLPNQKVKANISVTDREEEDNLPSNNPIGTIQPDPKTVQSKNPTVSRSRASLGNLADPSDLANSKLGTEIDEGLPEHTNVLTAKGKAMNKKVTIETEHPEGNELQPNPKGSKHREEDGGVQGEGMEDYTPEGAELEMEEEQGPSGPYGSQVVRRLHADMAGLLHEYDEFLENLEDESTRQIVLKQIHHFISSLEELEDHAANHPRYSKLFKAEPLEGMQMETKQGLGGDPNTQMTDPANQMMETSPEDAIQGMTGSEEDEFHKAVKSLRTKHKKYPAEEFQEKEEEYAKDGKREDKTAHLRSHLKFLGNKNDPHSKKARAHLIKMLLKAAKESKDKATLLQGPDKKHKPGHEACEGSEMDITLGKKGKKSQPSDTADVSPEKARKILKDGEANGKPLSEKQRGFFGAIAGKDKE